MKTLGRYVFWSFFSSFSLAFLVLTFVMTIGLMVKIVSYILDGIPMSLVGEFALVSFPETLQWTMPLALLVASVLTFSRMSADSEIAAMRACGVNLLSVMRGPFAFAVVCTLLGMYVNTEIVPRGHEVRRSLKSKVTVSNGLDVLQPGRIIDDFPKVKIYFGSKEGNWLRDLVVMDYSNPKVDRMITASKALVTSEGRDVSLDLYQMTVDPYDAEHTAMARANRFQYTIRDALRDSHYTRRIKDYRTREALEQLAKMKEQLRRAEAKEATGDDAERIGRYRESLRSEICNLRVELSKRFVFAFASLCFVLVGIPLGIKAQRKESTVGMAISLAISLGYYLVVMLMLSMENYYSVHPEWLIWLPVAACFALAARLLPRHL